jgi:hypothetical protein
MIRKDFEGRATYPVDNLPHVRHLERSVRSLERVPILVDDCR